MSRFRGLGLCLFYILYILLINISTLYLLDTFNGDPKFVEKTIFYGVYFDLLIMIMLIGLNIDLFIKWFKEFKWYYAIYPFYAYMFYICASIVLVLFFHVDNQVSENQQILEDLFSNLPPMWIIVKLAIIPPIIEEMVFRVGIYGLIVGKSKNLILIITGFFVSTIIFSGLHVSTEFFNMLFTDYSLYEFVSVSYPYFLMGGILSGIYAISRQNGLVNIGLHFLINFIASLAMISIV